MEAKSTSVVGGFISIELKSKSKGEKRNLCAAGDTVTGTFISALAVDSTPGPAISTATLDESSKPPALSAPKPF